MIVILLGMFIVVMILIFQLFLDVDFSDVVGVVGKMGKFNVVDFEFDLFNWYNFWLGMIGGVFLFLFYFGMDQLQVQCYFSGKLLNESWLGLLFNGILKVFMQFFILFVGVMVFVFFLFIKLFLYFNVFNVEKLQQSEFYVDYEVLD